MKFKFVVELGCECMAIHKPMFFCSSCMCSFQSIVVSLNRSDYMVDPNEDGTYCLKQIEINTISAAGFGVTDRLPEVHRYLRKCYVF